MKCFNEALKRINFTTSQPLSSHYYEVFFNIFSGEMDICIKHICCMPKYPSTTDVSKNRIYEIGGLESWLSWFFSWNTNFTWKNDEDAGYGYSDWGVSQKYTDILLETSEMGLWSQRKNYFWSGVEFEFSQEN